MKLIYGPFTVGEVTTNRSLTVGEALYALGYDISDPEDLRKAYEDDLPGAYIDEEGEYQIDIEDMEMEY